MTDLNMKHPNFANDLLPENYDVFKPEFRRDARGRYFMQLPGYGKWMIGNEPGSKIISQGSEDESGGPATSPESIMTGSLHANTIITVGGTIVLDAINKYIAVGEDPYRNGPAVIISDKGLEGRSGRDLVFALSLINKFLSDPLITSPSDIYLDKGDVFLGGSDKFIFWDDSEGELYVKGDLVIEGDIQSSNWPPDGYKLEYLTGIAYFTAIQLSGGDIGSSVDLPDSQTMGDVTGHVIATGNAHSADVTDLNDAQLYMDRVDETLLWDVIDNTAYYIQKLWTQKIIATGGTETAGVIIDKDGIRGYGPSNDLTFKLNAYTGDYYFGDYPSGNYTSWDTSSGILELNGTLYAAAGNIAGWAITSDRLWKEIGPVSGLYTKLELNTREAAGIDMHMQAFTDDNSSYSSPTGVQITPGTSTSPDPRLDIYEDGTRRVTLNTTGLRFYAPDGTTVTQKILMGTTDGDVTFGGGAVRCFANGVRTSWGQPFSAADSTGSLYFQMYVDTTSSPWGYQNVLSMSTSNYLKVENSAHGAIARFNGTYAGSYALKLFGNLGLYEGTGDLGSQLGAMYFNTTSNTLRLRDNTGWIDVGGGALPAGNAYDMLRHDGSTWISTADVYIGSRSDYYIEREGTSPNSMIFHIPGPASQDYAFKRGSQWAAVIDDNFWTQGDLQAGGALKFGWGLTGNISYALNKIYINKETHVTGSMVCTGTFQSGGAGINIGGTWFYPFWSATLGTTILATSWPA